LPIIVTDVDNMSIVFRIFDNLGVDFEMINSATTQRDEDIACRI